MSGPNIFSERRVTHEAARAILERVYNQFLLGALMNVPNEWECRELVCGLLRQLPRVCDSQNTIATEV